MTTRLRAAATSTVVVDAVREATGITERPDPVEGRSGGPAGNARLTAWTGLLLLILLLAESLTALDVRGFITWHIGLGALLVGPVLLKIATTSWRAGRYYTGNPGYAVAGPPPMVFRVDGPLLVVSMVALLATGIIAALVGPDSARTGLVGPLDLITLHQTAFWFWAVSVGVHVLGRLVPAWRIARARPGAGGSAPRVPGRLPRALLVVGALAAGVGVMAAVLPSATPWQNDRPRFERQHD